jgi:hypothetical protein
VVSFGDQLEFDSIGLERNNMPWKSDGTFVRINPDFEGNVWQDDQEAGIKVIATRHDFHDNDIAGGIADCLNLDGLNAMRADLNMGGFKIYNIGTDGEDEVSDGIFLPIINANASGFTYGAKHGGSWSRVGRFVTVMAYVDYANNPQTPNVPFTIGNLPFTMAPPPSGDIRQYQGVFAGWNNVLMSGAEPQGAQVYDGTQGESGTPSNPAQSVTYNGPQLFSRQLAPPTTNSDGKNVSLWRYIAVNDPVFPNQLVELKLDFLSVFAEFSFEFSYFTNDAQPT